jgi:phosphoglycerate kinase
LQTLFPYTTLFRSEVKSEDLFDTHDEKIVILENIRFYEEEEENDNVFAKHLASLADIYVNDAFSCTHRAHASIFEITKFIPSYAGLQLNLEIDALTKITSEIKKPITCIIGGSKISTKINIIKNLIPKFDNIIIVGGMANNILKFKGYNIGKSIQEDDCDKIIEEIFSLSVKKNCKIIYPEDVTVGKYLNGSPEIKELNNVSEDELILDIGPKSIKSINKIIEESNTILWNGPAGYFENPSFANGSLEIIKKIIEKNKANTIYSVAGGGDTVALLNSVGAVNNFDFVSTAGGAFLEYLEGKELPGIKALN